MGNNAHIRRHDIHINQQIGNQTIPQSRINAVSYIYSLTISLTKPDLTLSSIAIVVSRSAVAEAA